jgi:hypothetical protein
VASNGLKKNGNGHANGKALPVASAASKIARAGVKSGDDFTRLMLAIISDLADGSMSPGVAGAMCRAGANVIKIVEMQHRYGSAARRGADKTEKALTLG